MADPHWRSFLESDVLRFVDLTRDYAVQIATVRKGKVTGTGGKQSGKAMIAFTGWPKPLAAGAEVLSMISGMYGDRPSKWVGQWVTIWPDPTVKYGGAKVGGIRVRPTPPEEKDRVLPKTEQASKGTA